MCIPEFCEWVSDISSGYALIYLQYTCCLILFLNVVFQHLLQLLYYIFNNCNFYGSPNLKHELLIKTKLFLSSVTKGIC